MIKLFLFACACTMMVSCGVMQQLVGIIVDGKTRKPIAGVKVKPAEPSYRESSESTDDNGVINYHRYGSGQPITLQFEKEGYKSTSLQFKGRQLRVIKLDSINASPAPEIQMPEKELMAWIMFGDPKYNVDSVNLISKHDFNLLIDSCTHLLQSKHLDAISPEQHVSIMRCFNTVNRRIIKDDRALLFVITFHKKHYMDELRSYYVSAYDLLKNGTYYAKLRMQLYGSKRKWAYAFYKVTRKG